MHARAPFVNKGMHEMSAFNYMYNDENIRLGFRFHQMNLAVEFVEWKLSV